MKEKQSRREHDIVFEYNVSGKIPLTIFDITRVVLRDDTLTPFCSKYVSPHDEGQIKLSLGPFQIL